MSTPSEIIELTGKTETYLQTRLLPFWLDRVVDRECGGYLTYYNCRGEATGETLKPFLMQARVLFTMSSAHRAGYGDGRCADIAQWGADFLLDHYWDADNEGWIWIADRQGRATFSGKVGYGHAFALYAFSEYGLATGDPRGRETAERTYAAICKHMADTRHGGYFELLRPDWTPERPGPYGGDRKSIDVHMHLMEALTAFYELTRHPTHCRRLLEVMDLIIGKMLHPEFGTGYIQFGLDFQPLPAILFKVDWGRDAPPADGLARPLNYTSYGHNVEFAWLLLHAADILGRPRHQYADVARRIADHCVRYGIDREWGGVLVEGPMDGPAPLGEKQFWQQAEVLIGLLDAYALFGEERYWEAFRNVYDFVFAKFIAWNGGGEWFERLDRKGAPIDSALGHGWKNGYHTVRAMIQTVRRLKGLAARSAGQDEHAMA